MADVRVLRPAPTKLGTVLLAGAGTFGVANVVLIALTWPPPWHLYLNFGTVAALGLQGFLIRRARVELRDDGLRVWSGNLRPRHVLWDAVTRLRVDPPGGPRTMYATVDGRDIILPALRDEDRDAIFDAYQRWRT